MDSITDLIELCRLEVFDVMQDLSVLNGQLNGFKRSDANSAWLPNLRGKL
jgi:hypothetical protein